MEVTQTLIIEKHRAFTQFIEALYERYPPSYPPSHPRHGVVLDYRDIVLRYAEVGNVRSVIALATTAQLPHDQITAAAALIYD